MIFLLANSEFSHVCTRCSILSSNCPVTSCTCALMISDHFVLHATDYLSERRFYPISPYYVTACSSRHVGCVGELVKKRYTYVACQSMNIQERQLHWNEKLKFVIRGKRPGVWWDCSLTVTFVHVHHIQRPSWTFHTFSFHYH